MDTAVIRKIASLCKSEFVNKAQVGSHARGAVRVIRRTELPIVCAGRGIATGDTVAATKPSPSDGVTNGDVQVVRTKGETALSHCHIENLAAAGRHGTHGRAAVLIDNSDWWRTLCARHIHALLAGFSPRQNSCHNDDCDPKN